MVSQIFLKIQMYFQKWLQNHKSNTYQNEHYIRIFMVHSLTFLSSISFKMRFHFLTIDGQRLQLAWYANDIIIYEETIYG